jgi:dissimilatory sulfite reductase (desulfoviridin) alpha/beta subunit
MKMGAEDSIRMLLLSGGKHRELLGPAEWKRVKARVAWVRETVAKWAEAMRRRDDRCGAAVDRLSEEAFERLCDEEEAKVEAIHAQLRAVIERDEWPRELYWGEI